LLRIRCSRAATCTVILRVPNLGSNGTWQNRAYALGCPSGAERQDWNICAGMGAFWGDAL